MLSQRKLDHSIDDRKIIQRLANAYTKYIDGSTRYPEGKLISCLRFFHDLDWNVVPPYNKEKGAVESLEKLCTFLNTFNGFLTETKHFIDQYCLFKQDLAGITQVLVVAPIRIEDRFVCYVECFVVRKDQQKKGLGMQMVCQLRQYCRTQMGKGKTLNHMYIMLGMSKITKPHDFFECAGFKRDLPPEFVCWTDKDLDMAHNYVKPCCLADAIMSSYKKTSSRSYAAAIKEANDQENPENLTESEESDQEKFPKKRDIKRAKKTADIKKKEGIKVQQPLAVNQLEQPAQIENSEYNNSVSEYQSQLGRQSILTLKTNMSKYGHFNKHCMADGCNVVFITGTNWSRHLNDQHNGDKQTEVNACQGTNCPYCQKQGYKGSRAGYACQECGIEKRSDGFTNVKDRQVCKSCDKKLGSNLKIRSGQNKLTNKSLKSLNKQNQVGDLRHRSSIGRSSFNDRVAHDFEDNEPDQPFWPEQNNDFEVIDATAVQTEQIIQQQFTVVAKTDLQTIKLLKELEVSELSIGECAQQVQKVCEIFAQEVVVGFLSIGEHSKLSTYIVQVLKRVDQLEDNQIIGLIVASFTIGGICWPGTIKLLDDMEEDRRQQVLLMFKLCLCKLYKEEIADWCCMYWGYIDQQHIDLVKYLRINQITAATEVLMLSLTVVIQNKQRFVFFASSFVETAPITQMVIETINARPHQSKMSFDQFITLVEIIQDKKFASTIETINESLRSTQIFRWAEEIEKSKASSNVMDSDSIQIFLDQLSKAYGVTAKALQKDLTKTEDLRFGTLLIQEDNSPNARQFALAQYCIGKLYHCQRQMWVVPSGEGKSRITATVAAIALMTGMYTKVHLVFETERLCKRDKAEFELWWIVLDFEIMVQYHVGCDFEVGPNELVIVDEADALMYRDPEKFSLFIDTSACICFTATPDNQLLTGYEVLTQKGLKFEKFFYVLEAAAQKINLEFNKVVDLKTIKEKAAFIKDQSVQGPVLVFCDSLLAKELAEQECNLLMVDQETDANTLRHLDQKENDSYRVVIAQEQSDMRGLDYRSENVTMTLVIAKSFENQREAIQGFNRVGRFKDACQRIRFNDVLLVDRNREAKYNTRLMKFVSDLQKRPLVLKTVQVKSAQTQQVKVPVTKVQTTYSGNMNQKRILQLLVQPKLQFQLKE